MASARTSKVLAPFLLFPNKPRYGYELMDLTDMASGTLYPILRLLEHAGLLVGEKETVSSGAGPRRRYYRLVKDREPDAWSLFRNGIPGAAKPSFDHQMRILEETSRKLSNANHRDKARGALRKAARFALPPTAHPDLRALDILIFERGGPGSPPRRVRP
jgi:hypothetical protein